MNHVIYLLLSGHRAVNCLLRLLLFQEQFAKSLIHWRNKMILRLWKISKRNPFHWWRMGKVVWLWELKLVHSFRLLVISDHILLLVIFLGVSYSMGTLIDTFYWKLVIYHHIQILEFCNWLNISHYKYMILLIKARPTSGYKKLNFWWLYFISQNMQFTNLCLTDPFFSQWRWNTKANWHLYEEKYI